MIIDFEEKRTTKRIQIFVEGSLDKFIVDQAIDEIAPEICHNTVWCGGKENVLQAETFLPHLKIVDADSVQNELGNREKDVTVLTTDSWDMESTIFNSVVGTEVLARLLGRPIEASTQRIDISRELSMKFGVWRFAKNRINAKNDQSDHACLRAFGSLSLKTQLNPFVQKAFLIDPMNPEKGFDNKKITDAIVDALALEGHGDHRNPCNRCHEILKEFAGRVRTQWSADQKAGEFRFEEAVHGKDLISYLEIASRKSRPVIVDLLKDGTVGRCGKVPFIQRLVSRLKRMHSSDNELTQSNRY